MTIEVLNICKSFNRNQVLFNVNMKLESNKIYGLVGNNGSGKSLFLKILCGFYNMDSGKILLNNQDVFKEYDYLPNTRCLIEKPNFISELSGLDNLLLLASIQNKIGKDEILRTLEDVNLINQKDKIFSEYSLGMKQKLGIAQVLMEDPKIIILDEPFNGIDSNSVKKIRKLLLKEKEKGKLIIIATHNNEDIELLVDEIFYFKNGTVSQKKYK